MTAPNASSWKAIRWGAAPARRRGATVMRIDVARGSKRTICLFSADGAAIAAAIRRSSRAVEVAASPTKACDGGVASAECPQSPLDQHFLARRESVRIERALDGCEIGIAAEARDFRLRVPEAKLQ